MLLLLLLLMLLLMVTLVLPVCRSNLSSTGAVASVTAPVLRSIAPSPIARNTKNKSGHMYVCVRVCVRA
jgi:hypothetical protein